MTSDGTSLDDQIACLKREIAIRKGVYPKWVASGRMSEAAAAIEIKGMTAALHTVMRMRGVQDALEANFG